MHSAMTLFLQFKAVFFCIRFEYCHILLELAPIYSKFNTRTLNLVNVTKCYTIIRFHSAFLLVEGGVLL